MNDQLIAAEIFVGTDGCVYIKFSGFEDIEQAEEYANRIDQLVPFLFNESGTIH